MFAPVASELHSSDTLLVGDAPTKQDAKLGRPFFDTHGATIVESLGAAAARTRADVSWANVVSCRFPSDDAKSFLARLQQKNRLRKRKGQSPIPTPMECCRPRLEADLSQHKNLIPMGEMAIKAVLPGSPNPTDVRGGPRWVGSWKVLPTFHPRDLLKQPKYRHTFVADLGKAFRHFEDRLQWRNPEIVWNPTPQELTDIIATWRSEGARVAYDVETDSVEPLDARLRCIGLGTTDLVVMIHFLSRDGKTRFYRDDIGPWAGSLEDEQRIEDILRQFFVDPDIVKIGHNAGYYDRIVVEEHLGVTPAPLYDTILLHRLAESEYPHGLGFIGSVHTDVPAWKAENAAIEAPTDTELGSYCATDVAVTAAIVPIVKEGALARRQAHLYKYDRRLQEMCVGMHRLGMRVDEARRAEHQAHYELERDKWADVVRRAGIENPNSHNQVRELLFDKWELTAPNLQVTAAGEVSTGVANLIELMTSPFTDEYQREVIDALRRYKRADTVLTRYLLPYSPWGGVVRDGYIHADFHTHGTVARLSSSGPNFQNIPPGIRDIFIPPPGCVFVDADYDQLELRFAAALAGAKFYLDAFNAGKIDPHNLTAELMYGDSIWLMDGAPQTKNKKGSGKFKDIRDTAKTIGFASLYGAKAPKVAEILRGTTDRKSGDLPYVRYTRKEVGALHARWLRKVPEFKRWWEATVEFYRRNGYVQECVLGRRRYFHWEDRNAILNFGVQAGGFAIVTLGMLDVLDEVPFDYAARTGLVNQMHDSVTLAVPEARAEDVAAIVTEKLTRRVDNLPVTFTAEASILERWGK